MSVVTIEQWAIIVFVAFFAYTLGWITLHVINNIKRKTKLRELEKEQLRRREERYGEHKGSNDSSSGKTKR